MSHFVKSPNLPLSPVLTVAVGEDYAADISSALLSYGIRTIACPNNELVDLRLRSHIDLSVFHVEENRFVVSRAINESAFIDELIKLDAEIIVSDKVVLPDYPNDAALCALTNGKKLFHNLRCTDEHMLEKCGYETFHVNQGYAKCAACLISDRAAITADRGLSNKMKDEGFDVLDIGAHGISLEGFDEGFIGGAAFKIADNKLAFTGVLSNHPDGAAILNFLSSHGISPVFLSDKPIFDIGSVLPIIEQ